MAQAESVKCTAEGGSADIVGGRVNVKSRGPIERKRTFNYNANKVFPDKTSAGATVSTSYSASDKKFHSLPTRSRRNKASKAKPVARSVSDVSSKKVKRPSVFNLFSRKSDPNLHEISGSVNNNNNGDSKENSAEFLDSRERRVGRSKSDVGQSQSNKTIRKRNNSENEDLINPKRKIPLSPIIEQSQKEDYFVEVKNEQQSVPSPVKPRREKKHVKGVLKPVNRTENPKFPQNSEDLTIIQSKPVADSIKNTITTLNRSNSRSAVDMHSSQLPQEKPPLTKGGNVDGMVKRLSMERFSPPPHFSGPAFSYTRPKDSIIYAQVVCDGTDGKNKQTVHSSYSNKNGFSSQDVVDSPQMKRSSEFTSHHTNHKQSQAGTDRYRNRSQVRTNISDEDEGLGFEIKSKQIDDDFIPTHDRRYSPKNQHHLHPSDDEFKSLTEDIPITPNIRNVPPEKYYQQTNYQQQTQQKHNNPDLTYRGRGDGMDLPLLNEPFHELSHRREVLESRIKNRRMGSRELIDGDISPERDLLFKNPVYSHQGRHSDKLTKQPNGGRNYYKRTSPSPASPYDRYQRSRSTEIADLEDRHQDRINKKYHEFGSQEILKRYSPDRSHLDMIAPNQRQVSSKYEEESRYFHDGKEGYKETVRKETNIGKDGRPRVTESVSRERLDSPRRSTNDHRDSDRQYRIGSHTDSSHFQEKYRQEFNARDPDLADEIPARYNHDPVSNTASGFQSQSLKRQKKLQRSFDKGDSGIENDYRKDSFNDRDLQSKWKRRTSDDDKRACDVFLKRERRHTEDVNPVQRRYGGYMFRERSIDDGSHFDPRLDKYSDKRDKRDKEDKSAKPVAEKKKSGLEKVSCCDHEWLSNPLNFPSCLCDCGLIR